MKALALAAIFALVTTLALATPAYAAAAERAPAVHVSQASAGPDEKAGDAAAEEASGVTYQNLSTLGALLLGVLGLLWVRRHTAEL